MRGRKVAEKYAQALFELAREEDQLQQILTEFKEVAQIAEENQELNQLLGHPELTIAEKKEVLTEAFADQLSEVLFNFIRLLVDKKRESLIPLIYRSFKELVAEEEDTLEVTVEAAVELSTDQRQKLKEKLETSLDKQIELEVVEKPELIGGMVLKTKSKVLDVSFLNQLQTMQANLKNLEVS